MLTGGGASAGPPTRVPIVFMGLMGLDSHNREEEQLVRRLVERGHPLVYLPPLGVRDGGWGDLLAGLRRWRRAGRTANPAPGLSVVRLLVLPWRGRHVVACLNQGLVRWRLARALGALAAERPVLWLRLPTPELVEQLPRLGARAVVYDCMDDYSAYPHYRESERRRLQDVEQRLVAQADIVVTLTAAVAGRFPAAASRMRILPLGVDVARFGHPTGPEPADLARLPRPRLGLVGGLDGRIDLDLIHRLATAEPHWSIVLIGPLLEGLDIGPLADLPNVHLLGPRPYERVPPYLAGLDVCLIPYRRGSWADGCFPTKLHEYLAIGRPVVATDLPALTSYADVVELACGREAFLAACRRAVVEREPARMARRQARAAAHSQAARWRSIDDLLASFAPYKSLRIDRGVSCSCSPRR